LLSRLDVLAKLVNSQHDYERSLEELVRHVKVDQAALPEPPDAAETWRDHADALLVHALKSRRNCVVLNICVGLRHAGSEGEVVAPPAGVIAAIRHLLRRTVRESDCVAGSGETEFVVVTGSINSDAARGFAERVCRAIANAQLIRDENVFFVASCGLASLADDAAGQQSAGLQRLHELARRRALLGLGRGISGVIGHVEEDICAGSNFPDLPGSGGSLDSPDLPTLLQWLRAGRQSEVLPHLARLSNELQPLLDLMLREGKT
jgi:hypothetical protein